MRRTMILVFLLLGASIFITSNAFAAWTQAKGHSYNQLTFSYFRTTDKMTTLQEDEFENINKANAPAHKIEQEKFTATKLTYYGEFGILNDLTFVFSGGYDYLRSNDILKWTHDADDVSGIGDLIVGLRRKISNNIGAGVLMSFQANLKIPEAYDYENPLTHQNLGDGQYDLDTKLLFGKGFSKGYAVIDAGIRWRFKNDQLGEIWFRPSDQFRLSLAGGYNALSWLSIRGKLDWNRTFGNASVSDELVTDSQNYGVKSNLAREVVILDTLGLEQSSLSAGIALAFSITPKTQAVLSYNTDLRGFGVFKTENASLGSTYSLAFVYMH